MAVALDNCFCNLASLLVTPFAKLSFLNPCLYNLPAFPVPASAISLSTTSPANLPCKALRTKPVPPSFLEVDLEVGFIEDVSSLAPLSPDGLSSTVGIIGFIPASTDLVGSLLLPPELTVSPSPLPIVSYLSWNPKSFLLFHTPVSL